MGRIEVRGRRDRRCKQLVNHLKKRRGYFRLKEETVYGSRRRTRFGRGFGPVLRQAATNVYVCPKGPHTLSQTVQSNYVIKNCTKN